MKCTIPEISWHNKEPVLSVDIQQSENVDYEFYRLASGGSDNHILIWQLKILENGAAAIELLCDLTRHQRSVNVVRWSPSGHYLASADDDANIIIWTLKIDNIPSLDGDDDNKESWIVHKVLRGHKEDIYDMCWSPDGSKLLTGSIDNTAIVWDAIKGKSEHIIADHKSFVQGVAWNPTHHPAYMATLSSDRTCRILDTSSPRYQIRYRIARGTLPLPPSHPLITHASSSNNGTVGGANEPQFTVKLFHDDTFRTYFRRLTFTPDGSLLLVPSGYVEMGGEGEVGGVMYGTYVFPTMGSFSSPSAVLVSPRQCTIAVRCCPLLFELRPNGPDPYIKLPYRMIFAIATDSDVVLYDTQQTAPFAHLQNIHYTRLTDLTWSPDGRILAAASTDGFCTIVTFEANELGKIYVKEESEAEESVFFNTSGEIPATMEVPVEVVAVEQQQQEKDVEKEAIVGVKMKKKPSFLDQWTKISNKTNDDSISGSKPKYGCRAALFEPIQAGPGKANEFDCEFIDLSGSLSNDSGDKMKKRRITPVLLSSNVKTTTIRRITPTTLSQISSKSQRDNNLFKHVSEIIDLATAEGTKGYHSPSAVQKLKSPPPPPPSESPTTAKKINNKKTRKNTLLNFIQRGRGPKKTESVITNAPPSLAAVKTRNSTTSFSGIISTTNSSASKPSVKLMLPEQRTTLPSVKEIVVGNEETARDAWICCEQVLPTCLDLSEDIPEDFKLELEATTTNAEEEVDRMKDSMSCVNDKVVNKKNVRGGGDCGEVELGEKKDNERDVKVQEVVERTEDRAPVKRRVPLITLSSPKNKKRATIRLDSSPVV